MDSPDGWVRATGEIPEVEMEDVDWSPVERGRIGSKRVRDSPGAKGSYGFCGVTTAEKKPTLQPHDSVTCLKKNGNVKYVHMNSDGASRSGGRYLHAIHGLKTQPDFNALSRSSPGLNLENKTKSPTQICKFYAQGWCNKGKTCTFLHEKEGPDSAKAGLLSAANFGNDRGSEKGSQVQRLPNMKLPQFKDLEGQSKDDLYRSLINPSKDELYRNLINVYGEDKQNPSALEASQGITCSIDDSLTKLPSTPINELVQNPVIHEKNNKSFMGRHSSLAAETCLDSRGTFPRLLDGGSLQSNMDKGSLSDSHVSRTYPELNTLNSDRQYQSFGLPISSDPLQPTGWLSAYGGITENLPNTNQKHHRLSHALNSSHSLTGFINPGYSTPEHSFSSPTLQITYHQGIQSHHPLTPGIEKVDLHTYVDVDKGCGSPQPSIMPAGSLSPIKDEVWVTSVPFVPSFSFPDITSPSRSQYDPFVDSIEPPKVENTDDLMSSPCGISSQDTYHIITGKSLNCGDKLTRNMSAEGINKLPYLLASEIAHCSNLDDNNRVKVFDRKNGAVSNSEKTGDFRNHLLDHIRELIKPIWKEGRLTKEAHNLVVKKSVAKVLESIEPNEVPTTEELITNYLTTYGSKIEKLVKAYVEKYRTHTT